MARPVVAPTDGVVWIVDDGPDGALLARESLGSTFATRLFSSGLELLDQLDATALPDVLIIDWLMPGVSGLDVCKFLRSHEATCELSILLLTGQRQTEQIVEGLAAGANDYVTRPYSPAELIARVRSQVRATRARVRAQASHRSMQALLAHLPDGLITTTATGQIIFLNAQAEQILMTETHEVKGRHLGEIFPGLEKIHQTPIEGEAFKTLPDLELGAHVYSQAVARLELDGQEMIAVTLRDITEKRRLDTRRLDFYSMVAHDLRSPLTAMTLRVGEMINQRHGPLATQYRDDLGVIDARIGDLVKLINDFLDIARSENVGLTLARRVVDLAALVKAHLAGLSCGVTIRFDEPRVPIETLGDPARLTQAVANLISNAIKFSSKGGLVLVEVAHLEGEVEFAVSDAGRGIAEAKISELFRRHSRPDSDVANATVPGTDLGLMIVREIVAAHSGTCGVKSTEGKGSRLWFRLPIAASCAGADVH